MINCIHFSSDRLDLSTSNNMAKELNLSITKCTLGKMYSKICSLKVIEELANFIEVGIPCVTVDDYIIYVCLTSRYISNHIVDESLKGSRGVPHSTWHDLILVKAIWHYES